MRTSDSVILVVTGSRGITDRERVRAALNAAAKHFGARPTLLIHGACPGSPDVVAADLAAEKGIPTLAVPAPWNALGKKAGPHRNEWMLRAAQALGQAMQQPVGVCAVWDGLSKGTSGTMDLAKSMDIPVYASAPA